MTIENFWELFVDDQQMVQELSKKSDEIIVKKGSCIYKAGDQSKSMYFLMEGIARSYILTSSGKDITDNFSYKPGSILSVSGVVEDASEQGLYVEALEDCHLVSIKRRELMDVFKQNIEVLGAYTRILIDEFIINWKIKSAMSKYDAVERYEWFYRHYAEIADRVKQKDVASFLQMTPITLSKIKNGKY